MLCVHVYLHAHTSANKEHHCAVAALQQELPTFQCHVRVTNVIVLWLDIVDDRNRCTYKYCEMTPLATCRHPYCS